MGVENIVLVLGEAKARDRSKDVEVIVEEEMGGREPNVRSQPSGHLDTHILVAGEGMRQESREEGRKTRGNTSKSCGKARGSKGHVKTRI